MIPINQIQPFMMKIKTHLTFLLDCVSTIHLHSSLLRTFGFFCDLYLQFIAPIKIWNKCIDLRLFLKCKEGLFSRSLRSPRSNNLKIQNDENSKWKFVKTRWNPKFGLSDLENDLLTSTTSEGAQWIFSKNTFLKSVDQAEKMSYGSAF